MKKINVLIFPCGSENAGEIFQALRYSVHINALVGASGVSDHGEFRFDNYIGDLPMVDDERFAEAFMALLANHQIDMVFATHDTVALMLAELAQRHPFVLVNGDVNTARVTRYKSKTYELFQDCDWVPKRYISAQSVDSWPVIIKPDCGQGGNGVQIAHNELQLRYSTENLADPLIVEYLPGEEITVDCFTDRHRQLIWTGPRSRERVRAGISMRSQMQVLDNTITNIVTTINTRLLMRGPWFVQLKKDGDGAWKLLEISCRVAGTMVLQRARGVNLPLMAVHDYAGRNISPLPTPHITLIDRAIRTQSRLNIDIQTLYVDLDDTLLINGQAVPAVIALIYQYRSQGKAIVLITRHSADPKVTLRNAAIAESLFNDIIHLPQDAGKKSQFVTPNSLFIDNAFYERLDVAQHENIAVMDVDAVEFLLR